MLFWYAPWLPSTNSRTHFPLCYHLWFRIIAYDKHFFKRNIPLLRHFCWGSIVSFWSMGFVRSMRFDTLGHNSWCYKEYFSQIDIHCLLRRPRHQYTTIVLALPYVSTLFHCQGKASPSKVGDLLWLPCRIQRSAWIEDPLWAQSRMPSNNGWVISDKRECSNQ